MQTQRFAMMSFAALMLAGCATNGPSVQTPDVRLNGVEVMSLSMSKQRFKLSFDVSNPNPFPLPVQSVRYMVLLEQQRFAGGETGGRFTIPASGDGAFAISVELDLMHTATSLASVLTAGAARPLEYELHGSLDIAMPFARPLNFVSSGTIMVQGDGR